MKRQIDFGDKNYIDCPTDKCGLFIRLYISSIDDGTWLLDTMQELPENDTPIEFFRVNEKVKGLFFLRK